ncbi:MAG: sigma 54-interacting transcriptional regulator [Sandaracinaceae bacterium]|nr:sigma 54-interacting transcriptional regulator [Sandaracinaceae bacterium]
MTATASTQDSDINKSKNGARGAVLVVDDDPEICELVASGLRAEGFWVRASTSPTEALTELTRQTFDAVVTDLQMEEMDGLQFCERALAIESDLPVILITGRTLFDTAVAALRVGAYDFIAKPIDVLVLRASLTRAIERRRLHSEVKRLRAKVTEAAGFDRLIGESPPMRHLCEMIGRVSGTDATVLISGDSGTGKELVARAVHDSSTRKSHPFIAINCAAVPATLLESELFGVVKGAYTDAKASRRGLFLDADGGTLFLDEIGELPLDMQAKLLRALQERRVRPVGGSSEQPFDARVITATNRDLEAMVREGKFREDLFYRINVVGLEVPALKERGGDILLLAQYFIEQIAARFKKDVSRLAPSAAEKLLAYEWPGNVRELENCIERAVTLTRFDEISIDDLPERVRQFRRGASFLLPATAAELVTLDELERRYVEHVLRLVRGNKSKAARVLGRDRRTLYRKLEAIGEAENAASPSESTPPAARTAPPKDKAPVKASPRRILIVEDDVDTRDLLRDVIETEGYEVELADTVAQAKEFKGRVDFVLSDLNLPDGSGSDVAKFLAPMPTIAMTGSAEPAEHSEFVGWLTKPIALARLHQELAAVSASTARS